MGESADPSNDDPFAEYRGLQFMDSRIPIQDALSVFVKGVDPPPPEVQAILDVGESRWYPREGGHEVLIPYHNQQYDPALFSVRKGAWDHETCSYCRVRIPPMTLCHVTPSGWYVLLCETCFQRLHETAPTS
jgi:hypothetical protein